jgi:hypothetical protein
MGTPCDIAILPGKIGYFRGGKPPVATPHFCADHAYGWDIWHFLKEKQPEALTEYA